MSELFDHDCRGVRRKETGSKLGLDLIFLDIEGHVFYYENPVYEVKIEFWPIILTETFALKTKRFDHVIQQPVNLEIILKKDDLRNKLERGSVRAYAANVMITDIYELMAAMFINGIAANYFLDKSDMTFRVYEAEMRRFNEMLLTVRGSEKMGHETVEALQAELVFESKIV